MRHSVFGKKLSRTKNERRRLLQGLARDMILRDGITTTLAKAKAVQPLMEKLVTKAKHDTASGRIQMLKVLADRTLVIRLIEQAKTRFATRTSGFTRIIKAGVRRGDATQDAMLTFVDPSVQVEVIAPTKTVKAKPAGKVINKPAKSTSRKPKAAKKK